MTPTRPHTLLLATFAAAALFTGCARVPAPEPPIPPVAGREQTMFALRYIDVRVGTGAGVESGTCVYAHYTGWLTDGTKFDSSRDTTPDGTPRTPIAFQQGARRVIAGWDDGFMGMREGGHRRLLIPYQLAYGESGRPPVIPPSAPLIFDVELMAVSQPRTGPGTPPGGACPRWDEIRR
jgi:peptidylprolyl isomerase